MTKKQQSKKNVDTKKEENVKVVGGKQEQRDVSKSESSSAATSGVQSTDVDPSITTHAPSTRPSTIGLDTIYARTGSEEHHDEASPREPSKTTADISSTTTKAKKEPKSTSESSASATSESGDVDPSITTHAPSTRPSTIGIDTIYARTGSGEHVSSPRESSKTTGESGKKESLETKQGERFEKRSGASEHARSDDAVHDYGNLQPATEDLARQGKRDTKESKGGNVKEKKGEGKSEGKGVKGEEKKGEGKSVKGEEKKVHKEKEVEGVHGGKEKGHKKEGGHKKEKGPESEHKTRGREGHGQRTRLNSGHNMPLLAFGTWKLEKDEIPEAIKGALEAGFRHIDCAQDYMNEDSVGDVLKAAFDKGTVSREDLFITSKLNQQYHDPKHVKAQLRKTLRDLQLDNLDLFLMHWPIAMSHVPFDENQRGYSEDYAKRRKEVTPNTRVSIRDTWLAMEECVKEGLTKSIGVSNFPVALLHDLLSYCNMPPAVNQVELHPYLQQNNLVNYCNSRDVAVMGYSSLGSGSDPSLLDDSELQDIAEQLHITPAQLCLAWSLSRDIGAVVRSSNTEHIAENMQAWKLADQLKDDVKKRIERLDRGYRFLRPENLSVFGGVPLFD